MNIQRALIEMRNFRINTSFGINNTSICISVHPFEWRLKFERFRPRHFWLIFGPFNILANHPKRTSTPE